MVNLRRSHQRVLSEAGRRAVMALDDDDDFEEDEQGELDFSDDFDDDDDFEDDEDFDDDDFDNDAAYEESLSSDSLNFDPNDPDTWEDDE